MDEHAKRLLTPAQRYYQNHKEIRKAYGREYYEKNKERILEANQKKKKVSFAPETIKPELISPVVPSPLDNFRGRGIIVKKGYDIETKNIVVSFT
jgi:hypothetical protein